MSIPEWVMITLVGSILAVIGWAAKRLVEANDSTNSALVEIGVQMGGFNIRLKETEWWRGMHDINNERRFHELEEEQKEQWFEINNIKRDAK